MFSTFYNVLRFCRQVTKSKAEKRNVVLTLVSFFAEQLLQLLKKLDGIMQTGSVATPTAATMARHPKTLECPATFLIVRHCVASNAWPNEKQDVPALWTNQGRTQLSIKCAVTRKRCRSGASSLLKSKSMSQRSIKCVVKSKKRCYNAASSVWSSQVQEIFFLRLPFDQYGPVSKNVRSKHSQHTTLYRSFSLGRGPLCR